MSEALALIYSGLQLLLLAAAVWLAFETRRLRQATRAQLEHGYRSEQNAVATYIYVAAVLDEARKVEKLQFENVTDRLAINAFGFIFDGGQRNFTRTRGLSNFIRGSETIERRLEERHFDIDGFSAETCEVLSKIDRNALSMILSETIAHSEKTTVIGVIYADSIGNYYLIMRALITNSEHVLYKALPWANRRYELASRS